MKADHRLVLKAKLDNLKIAYPLDVTHGELLALVQALPVRKSKREPDRSA